MKMKKVRSENLEVKKSARAPCGLAESATHRK
jgi:hypothetical protein